MSEYSLCGLEIAHVAYLVYFIESDSLNTHYRLYLSKISVGCREYCDAGSGEAYLRGRGKIEYHILASALFTFSENIKQLIALIVIKIVYCVCVIPEDSEILCLRLKCRKASYGLVGICDSVGI